MLDLDMNPSVNEYDFDSSDEEDIRNTVGNIPLQWYQSFAHIGYDTSGRPIMKPNILNGNEDAIDKFLKNTDNVNGESKLEWRSIRDPVTGQLVILDDKDLEVITKISSGQGISEEGENELYKPWVEWFSQDVMITPLTAHPPQKRSFIPSLVDRRRVGRIVYAIKNGRLKPKLPSWALEDTNDLDALRRYGTYITSGNIGALDSDDEEDLFGFSSSTSFTFPDMWENQDQDKESGNDKDSWKIHFPMLASDYRPPRPRPYQKAAEEPLPGHIVSYNPPPEFLLSRDEEKKLMKVWRERVKDGYVSRVPPQMPRKFTTLRHVPFSENYLREREERVKDLMMATRLEKQRVATDPDSVLPEIPSLSQLKPYPNHIGIRYKGHKGRVTSLSVSPCGQWLASISPSDCCLRIWEAATNYCFRVYHLATGEKQNAKLKIKESTEQKNIETADDDDDDSFQDEHEEWSNNFPTALVAWNPNPELHLLAAAIGPQVFVINPALCDRLCVSKTHTAIVNWWNTRDSATKLENTVSDSEMGEDGEPSAKRHCEELEQVTEESNCASWSFQEFEEQSNKLSKLKDIQRHRIVIGLSEPIISLDWHAKGDYLITLSRSIQANQMRSRSGKRLLLHRLSKMSSQSPFSDMGKPAEWKQVAFHPLGKPQLFVAGSKSVRILDLVQQKELRRLKLDGSVDFVSSMALHSSGDHLAIGTYGSRFNWFDVDLGSAPFKKLQLKHGAIRQLDIHPRYPLTSLALSDGRIMIVYAKVTDDLLTKPVIIPIHVLATDQPPHLNTVFAIKFHPRQPHVYSGGADGSINQYVAWH